MSVDLAELALSVDANGFVKADQTMDRFNKTASNTEKQADKITKSTDSMSKSMLSAEKAVGFLKSAFFALTAALSIHTITEYSDSWTNVSNTLRGVVESQSQLISTQSKIINLAKETSSSLDATAGLYSAITRSVSDLGVSQNRIIGVTKTINNLFLAGGKSAAEAAGAIIQLNQGLAAGALRGDEFNSVAEGAPRILDAVAQKLGMTRGALRDFAATGGITAEILISSLESYSTEAQKAVDITQRTFSQSTELSKTFVLEWVGASTALSMFSSVAGKALVSVAKNIDLIVEAAKLLGVILVGVGVANFTKYALSIAAVVKQQLLLNTTSITTRNALGYVSTTAASATVAQNALALSTRALGGLMGLLGGPFGVITIAAAGLYYFFTRATEAEKIVEKLGDSTDELVEKFKLLGAAQQQQAKTQYQTQFEEAANNVDALQKKLSALQGGSYAQKALLGDQITNPQVINDVSAALEVAKQKLAAIQEKLTAIDDLKTFEKMAGAAEMGASALGYVDKAFSSLREKLNGSSDEFKKRMDEIEKQIYLQGSLGKAEELAYDVAHGNIENLKKGEGELLVAAQKRQDAQLKNYDRLNNEAKDHAELIKNTEEDINDAIDKSIEKRIAASSQSVEDSVEQVESIKKMSKEIDNFGGAWSRTGSIIVDAFGSVADSILDYNKRMQELIDQQAELSAKQPKTQMEAVELQKAQLKLTEQTTIAGISGYGKIAGAAGSFFKEQSKGRKALNNAEKVFTAIEIALAAKKAAANALTAITSAFSAPFPVNFAAGAAMIAIMSGLGVFGGGGGGSAPSAEDIQKQQGTGTVLGDTDAKSQSIIKALEEYKDVGIDQLAELRGIRDALTGLSQGIQSLANSLVRGGKFSDQKADGLGTTQNTSLLGSKSLFGSLHDPITAAIFGSTSKKLTDTGLQIGAQQLGNVIAGDIDAFYYNTVETTKKKFFGLSKKTSTKDELTGADADFLNQVSQIFGFIGGAVNESLGSLGITANKAINNFVLSIGKVSFKDLSGDEIQKELESIFGQQADLLAKYVFPGIEQFQKLGEGAFQTLTRVAKQQAVFNDSIATMGLSLDKLSKFMQIQVAQSIIDLMGGLDEFTSKANAYFNAFFSDSEKLARLGGSLSDAFKGLGVSMPETNAGFRALVEGIDLTTKSGQKLFASLLEIAPSFDQYTKAVDKEAKAQQEAAQKALEAEEAQLKAAQAAQERIKAQRDDIDLKILDELGLASEALTIRRRKELDTIDESNQPLQKYLYSLQDLNKNIEEASRAVDELNSQVNDSRNTAQGALSALQASVDAEKQLSSARLESAQAALTAAQAQRDSAQQIVDDATNVLKSSFGAQIDKITKERETKAAALDYMRNEAAQARQDSIKSEIQGYNELANKSQAYAQNLRSVSDSIKNAINGMAPGSEAQNRKAAQAQIDAALGQARQGNFSGALNIGDALSALGNTDGIFKTSAERDYDVAVTQGKLAELANLTDSQATIEEKSYQAALDTVDRLNSQLEVTQSIDAGIKAILDQGLTADQLEASIKASDDQAAALKVQLDAMLGIDNSIASIDEAIKKFVDAKEQLAIADAQLETAKTALAVAQSMYDAEIAAYDQLIKQQTDLYNSALGIDDSVKSVSVAVNDLSSSLLSYADVSKKQQEALASLASQQIIANAQKSANDTILTDEITRLRSENKDLQEKMASSLRTIADNSTSQLNLDRLNA